MSHDQLCKHNFTCKILYDYSIQKFRCFYYKYIYIHFKIKKNKKRILKPPYKLLIINDQLLIFLVSLKTFYLVSMVSMVANTVTSSTITFSFTTLRKLQYIYLFIVVSRMNIQLACV